MADDVTPTTLTLSCRTPRRSCDAHPARRGRAHRRRDHRRGARATPTRSAGPMGETIADAVRARPRRLPPARGAVRGSARRPRLRRPSTGPTSSAAARRAAAARSTRCSSAYRIGARVSWRELSSAAVAHGRRRRDRWRRSPSWSSPTSTSCPPPALAGHTDELETHRPGPAAATRAAGRSTCSTGRRPRRSRPPPSGPSGSRRRTLTAVLAPGMRSCAACSAQVDEPHAAADRGRPRCRRGRSTLLLVPDVARPRPGRGCCATLSGLDAVVGPARAVAAGARRPTTARCAVRDLGLARHRRLRDARSTWPSSSSPPTRTRSPTCGPRVLAPLAELRDVQPPRS